MQNTKRNSLSLLAKVLAAGTATAAALVATGCGAGFTATSSAPVAVAGAKLQGSVHGGQQPVAGATIQLYAANLTGYGVQAFPLLTTAVASTPTGTFGITGDYTCPSASTPVYITATGGNSGSGANTGLAMMAALGACGNLNGNTYISMNELTTVAGAYALSAFMSSPTQLSTSATNATGLTNAFASVNKLVNTATGTMPGSSLPTGATAPTAELNTLADIIAACINSTTGSTMCTSLYSAATPAGGTAPADTLTAILDIAKNPANNAGTLYGLVTGVAPFQPTLATAPTDFTVAVKYIPTPTTFSTPSAAALDASGNLWVTNAGNNTITVLNATTAAPTIYAGTLSTPSGIAFDATGNAWVPNKGNSSLSVFTSAGVGTTALNTNLSTPTSVAIDGQGVIWVTNSGNSSVTAATPSGTTVVSSTVYSTGGLSAPVAVSINPH